MSASSPLCQPCDDELVWKARDIIANGCGCDQHECKGMVGPDVRCGCKDDAEAILALFRATHPHQES